MAKIVIIGAGLTGLSAAYHLEKKGFYDYKIFEKENEIGGLCRSVQQDGFTFDFTGHLLHISNSYFHSIIKNKVGFDNFNKISRRSFIYSHGTHTPYPYQINLHGLPLETIVDCIEGFVGRKKAGGKTKNYYQWVLQNFGSGFGKHFFFPYQRKIFDYDLRKLSSSWTGRFVPSTTLRQIIRGSISKESKDTVGYNARFFYPKQGGIFFWINKFAQKIKNPVHKNFCAKKIDLKNKVILFSNGHSETFTHLISTMPLNILLKNVTEKSSTHLQGTAEKLLCNSVINFNLGIAKPQLSVKHWAYYPEPQFPFYRLGFPHNFSAHMAPKECSSLYGEFSYLKKSKKIVSNKLKAALTETKKLLSITEKEILTEKIIHIPHAYVIYDFWREKHLPSIHKRLQEQEVYSIGRYGHWKYSSMQEAVLDGKLTADLLTVLPAKKLIGVKRPKKDKSRPVAQQVVEKSTG